MGGVIVPPRTVMTVTTDAFQERSWCFTVEDCPAVIAEINRGFVEALVVELQSARHLIRLHVNGREDSSEIVRQRRRKGRGQDRRGRTQGASRACLHEEVRGTAARCGVLRY